MLRASQSCPCITIETAGGIGVYMQGELESNQHDPTMNDTTRGRQYGTNFRAVRAAQRSYQ